MGRAVTDPLPTLRAKVERLRHEAGWSWTDVVQARARIAALTEVLDLIDKQQETL
jgi:hypothetical protein